MKRITFKSTQRAKNVMIAVAESRHKDIGDLIHEYFYELAKEDLISFDATTTTNMELENIFHEAIML